MRDISAFARWRPHWPQRAELSIALLTAAASLTPSLLPKTVLVQGLITGIAATVGYGLGAMGNWLLTPLRQRLLPATRDRITVALLGAGLLWLLPAVWLEQVWQGEVAASIGETNPPPTNAVVALLIATALVVAAVAVARSLKMMILLTTRRLATSLPQWLAISLAMSTVLGLTSVAAYQVIRHRVLDSVDQSFRLVNREPAANLPIPEDTLRSGGPGSLVSWSTLGRAGRTFISLPDPDQGQRPIRVYAGIDSAASLQDRADLVVAELERTGGLHRSVVCVVVPTGTGWVDQDAVTALEAQWAGDSAVASMQYSYLPSVLSLVIDRLRVDGAARALIGAVVRRWRSLPKQTRPRLVFYGESLGSRGVEVALRSVPHAREVVSGVLLVGPPNSNPTWTELVARRDPGSLLLAPVVDGGRSVRFWPGKEMPDYNRTRDPWPEPASGPRTLYLQHPSDPIVWWSPSLLWSEPPWVEERTIVNKAPSLQWKPIVTFWQISGDAAFSNDVPRGHGHRYGEEMSAAWAAVAPRTSNTA